MVETQHTEQSITLTDKSTGQKSYREQDVPKISKDMLNLLRDREAFLLFSGHATNRTHTGVISLIKGQFSKEANEFIELKMMSRNFSKIIEIGLIRAENENPFV